MYFGVWFFKAGLLSFCRCSFLSLQLTLPSKWHFKRVKWDSPQHAEQHDTAGTQKCGVGLKHSCKFVFRDGKGQASCVLCMKASVSHVVVTSLALFWSDECADMGLTWKMEICLCNALALAAEDLKVCGVKGYLITGYSGQKKAVNAKLFFAIQRISCCLVPTDGLCES